MVSIVGRQKIIDFLRRRRLRFGRVLAHFGGAYQGFALVGQHEKNTFFARYGQHQRLRQRPVDKNVAAAHPVEVIGRLSLLLQAQLHGPRAGGIDNAVEAGQIVQRADFVMAAHFYAQLPALFDNPLAQCKIIHLCIIK